MRLLRWALALVLLAAAGLFGAGYAMQRVFNPTPPTPHYPHPHNIAEEQAQDLDYFKLIFSLDKSWTPAMKSAALAKLGAVNARAGQMSPTEFELAITQLVALADNGHTHASARHRIAATNRVPIRLFPFADGFVVVRAQGEQADLLGLALVAIDAHPIEELVAAARTLAGGLARRRDMGAPYFLESPDQLHALGLAEKSQTARYRFRSPDGSLIERELAGEPLGARRIPATAERALAPAPIENEPPDWRGWIAHPGAPLALQDPDSPFRTAPLDDLKALYVELRQNENSPGHPIAKFLAVVRTEIAAAKPTNLVLDMRFNGGGDYTTTVRFMKSLPGLVPGRTFVLTGPLTFSAAITSTAFVKAAGKERVTIVGEPVGDRLIFYSEGGSLTLPNSGIPIRFATGLHDYRNGCRWFGPCYWMNYVFPVAVPALDPEIAAPLTAAALSAGRDPGLEAVAAALGAPI
jgi:hypothetical protein